MTPAATDQQTVDKAAFDKDPLFADRRLLQAALDRQKARLASGAADGVATSGAGAFVSAGSESVTRMTSRPATRFFNI